MSREGIDFCGPRPSAEAMRAAGRDFVVRYARSFTHPKSITEAERVYWQANGIDIAIVDESAADRALAGRPAGQADAKAARAAIVDIGGPADGVIYAAADFDATAAQMPAVLDYIRGYADVLGHDRTGVYGAYRVMAAAAGAGVCKYLWQTYAWSGGQVFAGIHLYQYRNAQTLGGVEVDYCRTSLADFGQWGATGGLHMDTDVSAAFTGLNGKLDRLLASNTRIENTSFPALSAAVKAVKADTAAELDDEAKVKAAVSDARTAILAGLAALPVGEVLSDEEIARLGSAIAEKTPVIAADDVVSALKARITEPGPTPA